MTGSTGADIFMGFGSQEYDCTIKVHRNVASYKGYI
jgi:hypothetical protein